MSSQPTPMKPVTTRARGLRAWIVVVVLVAAAGGIYIGALWHASIARVLGIKDSDGTRGVAQSQDAGSRQLWTCGMHPQVIQDHPGDCPICHMKLTPMKMDGTTAGGAGADQSAMSTASAAAPAEAADARQAGPGRKIKYWWDPMMNPPYISDKPGKSPMGMDLVPVYETVAPSSPGQVVIDPAVVQNMGVRTAVVTEGPLERSVRIVGYLDEAEPNIRDINLRVSGWVRRLYTNTEGQHVEAGDPLFDLYSPELQVAIEELISARRAVNSLPTGDTGGSPSTAATLRDAATRKLRLLGLDPRQIEALAKLDTAPETVTFASPITGYLTEKPIVEGAAVQAGQRALRIVDQSVLWLEGQVFEKDMPFVRVSQEATARIAAGPGAPGDVVSGEVVFVRPRLDTTTRTITVRLAIPNPALTLRPGMYATMRLESRLADHAILVPREAVIDTGEKQVVFVAGPAGHFEPRKVTMGLSADGGLVQIAGGLTPGETVVTSGQFLLDSESRLREAIQKFLGEKTRTAFDGGFTTEGVVDAGGGGGSVIGSIRNGKDTR